MDYLNNILAALSSALDGLYPQIPIYTEVVPQELPLRCFLIGYAGSVDVSVAPGDRRTVSGSLDITYLAPENALDCKQELNQVFANISLQLQRIRFGDLELRLTGHRREGDGSDNTMHDICGFKTFLLPPQTDNLISTVEITKEGIK